MTLKHLTDEQLSAYLDGAIRAQDAEAAERHLAGCQPCREALAELAAQDESLKPVLHHDPGEAYFESFAARVAHRLRGPGPAGATTRGGLDLGRLFRSPRALAWAGTVAVVVVGGGLALMTSREGRPPELRGPQPLGLSERAVPAEPSPSAPHDAVSPATPSPSAEAPAAREEAPNAKAGERAAAPTHAIEMRKTESGEDVPVRRDNMPVVPAPSAAGNVTSSGSSEGVKVHKQAMAEPLGQQASPLPAASSLDAGAPRQEAEQKLTFASPPPAATPEAAMSRSAGASDIRQCGDVRDAQGRPIAGAQVVASDLGRSASTDSQGHFCLSLPPGEHPVAVMAVGYTALRRTLRTGDAEARLTLAAVPVLDGGRVALAKKDVTAPGAVSGTPDKFSALPDSMRGVVREAERLEADADLRHSAAQFDAAARAWEGALKSLAGGPLEVEARRHHSTTRYRAWELAPTEGRSHAAADALGAYVARAPAGPERAQAAAWLERLRP